MINDPLQEEQLLQQRLKDKLAETHTKPTIPNPGTDEHLVFKYYSELNELREQAAEFRRRGLGYKNTWRELSAIFSETCGKEFSSDYLRKLFYSVKTKYKSEGNNKYDC